MPAHEQALEYLAVPEHADAYIGTSLGFWVTCRAAISAGEASSRAVRLGGKSRLSFAESRSTRTSLMTSGAAVLFELDPMTEYEVGVMTTVVILDTPKSRCSRLQDECVHRVWPV